jgi:hypothetical protein
LVFTVVTYGTSQPDPQFGPLRTSVMSNSDYRNHPALAASCRPTCAGATPKARYPDMLAAQRRERACIRSERQQRWGRPKPKAA